MTSSERRASLAKVPPHLPALGFVWVWPIDSATLDLLLTLFTAASSTCHLFSTGYLL